MGIGNNTKSGFSRNRFKYKLVYWEWNHKLIGDHHFDEENDTGVLKSCVEAGDQQVQYTARGL